MDLSYLVVFAYCLPHSACARGRQGKSSSNASLETCARFEYDQIEIPNRLLDLAHLLRLFDTRLG